MPVALVAVLVAVLMLAPADAAHPGSNGKIAFQRDGQIWIMNGDGSGQKRLKTRGNAGMASFSPDGHRIAYQGTVGDDTEIWVMNADGSNQKRLTKSPQPDVRPSFSGDGKRIIFQSDRSFPGHIYVMNANGSNQRRLVAQAFEDAPSASPAGPIAYTCTAATTEVCSVNADGSGFARLTNREQGFTGTPHYSADGRRIVFRGQPRAGFEVFIMNADGSQETQLTEGPPDQNVDNDEPAFSPDGQRIVFESSRDARGGIGVHAIYVMNADGSQETRLAANGEAPDWGPVPTGPAPDGSVEGVAVGGSNKQKLKRALELPTKVTSRSEQIRATASGKVMGNIPLRKVTQTVAAGGSKVLTQKVAGSKRRAKQRVRRIRAALEDGKTVKAEIAIKTTDSAGNRRLFKRTVRIVR